MKKKLVAVVLVAILLTSILSGCTLFVKNDERDYKQVLATVENRGITATITKGEFYDYYSQTSPIYIQYYGWDEAKCINEFMNALGRKEILNIEARAYFSTKQNKNITTSAFDLLSQSEQAWVIRRSNKTFQDALDEQVKSIVADDKANAGVGTEDKDDDEVSKLPPARAEKPKVDEDEKYKDSMTDVKEDLFFDAIGKKTLTATEKKALKKVEKTLKDQYKDYNYFLEQNAESRLYDKYKDEVKNGNVEGYSINITDEDVVNKYNLSLNQQAISNANEDAYKTALDGTSMIVYHNNQYVKVKSILLQFSESQKGLLEKFKELNKGNKDIDKLVNEFREKLVNGGDNDLNFENKHFGLLVNISNSDYKPDQQCTAEKGKCPCKDCPNSADYDKANKCDIVLEDKEKNEFILNVPGCPCETCVNNAYSMYNVPYEDAIKQVNVAVNKAGLDAGNEYFTKYPDGNEAGKLMYIANARAKEFENWIYKLNDDPGMMEGKEYLATPDYKKSEYVVEYTALIRALIEKGATKGSMDVGGTQDYTVDGKVIPITTVTGDNGEKISYIINDFGVHIVMLTTVPVDLVINADNGTITKKIVDSDTIPGIKDTHYTLGMGAIIGFNEDTGLPITVKDQLKKDMEEKAKTDLYSRFEQGIVKDYGKDLFLPANKAVFKYNKNILAQLVGLTKAAKKDITLLA